TCALPILLFFIAPLSFALGETSWLSSASGSNFILADKKSSAQLIVDKSDFAGVQRAAKNLQTDIEKVSGKKPVLAQDISGKIDNAVIIGTLGKSQLIQDLITADKLDVSAIQNQWDGFLVRVVNQPTENISRALVIVGADKRGTTYGIYSLSQQIGVSPWYWWADVPVKQHAQIYIHKNLKVVEIPKVKYRGIFLNDEAPALTGWVTEKY